MKLILIVNDRLRFFYLPKVVKNNYWITYLDDNGLEQNLINIEAIDGKWQIIMWITPNCPIISRVTLIT